MKPAYFVCLPLLVAATLFSQSTSSLRPNQPHALPSLPRFPEQQPLAPASQRPADARPTVRPQAAGLNFAPAVVYPSNGDAAYSVVVADVNGDGKPDVVAANVFISSTDANSGTVAVLLGNGDGTFQPAMTYGSGGYAAFTVAVGDVNGDGKIDIVVANQCVGTGTCFGAVGVLLGKGDGTFQAAIPYESGGYGAQSVAVTDVNGDGKPDLVVANECATSVCSNGGIGVLLGNGDGTFQPAVIYGSGGYDAFGVGVADVNGDGKQDLVVANLFANSSQNGNGAVGVLLGNGDGTFQAATPYGSGGFETYSIAIGDVNGDGKPDLLVANSCSDNTCANTGSAGVLLGNGDGTFNAAVTYSSGGRAADSIAVADLDGDGRLDIAVTNQCPVVGNCNGSVAILLGNGDGTFQNAVTFASGGQNAVSVAASDVNGDGKPDLVVANGSISGALGVLINASVGATTTALISSPNPSGLAQTILFTATVSSQIKGIPTGLVSFFDGATSLGSSSLNSAGVATLSSSTLAIGTHSITASYAGDSNFGSSTSEVLSQVVQGAIVQLSPPSVNFGNATVGGNGTQQGILVNLTNTGNVALNISSIAITGADSGDFIQSNLCPSSLAASLGCTISVQFVPTTTGTRTGALTVTDNATNSPQSVSLTGVGVSPAVTLSPSSLSFPTQVVFTNSKTQTVTLNNTGLGYLFITNVAVSAPFTQTNNCGSTVSPGSSCTFTVTFKPTKAGAVTGALSISDNAPLSPQTVSLKGTGTYVQFNPVSFNFGNQPVGTKSLPKKITLGNKGSVAVSVTKISLTGINAADFAETNTCGTRVAAGASCFITVTFTPSAKGLRSASVTVVDNGGGSPQKVGVAGTGT